MRALQPAALLTLALAHLAVLVLARNPPARLTKVPAQDERITDGAPLSVPTGSLPPAGATAVAACRRKARSPRLPLLRAALPAERAILLKFRDGITNWAEVKAARGYVGWEDCVVASGEGCQTLCSWSGVVCGSGSDNSGSVTQL